MARVNRVLDPSPVESLEDHLATSDALRLAAGTEPVRLIEIVEESGLRGRGGAGFPTGTKWRTVSELRSSAPFPVVVNAAEGEPGTFKDRTLLRTNPYRVLEGAAIAARAVGASQIIVAIKSSFEPEIARLRRAIDELGDSDLDLVPMSIVTGPSEYLFGEESAMLEVIDGRPPLPRVTPPYRRGIGEDGGERNTSSDTSLAGDDQVEGSPALVNNVETLANVGRIVVEGPEAFRTLGTDATPGTVVCTISGSVRNHGVAEFEAGTPLWEVIDDLGGGAHPDRTLIAALPGTASGALVADHFDTPLCFDALRAVGSGLGAAGFIVLDDQVDLVAAAHGVSRFLAIESCGQCTPCKADGTEIARHLDDLRRADATASGGAPDVGAARANLERHFERVDEGARCALAGQQSSAVRSLYELAGETVDARVTGEAEAVGLELIAPLVGIEDGTAVVDTSHLDKSLDWSTDGTDSGAAPADRLDSDR